VPTKAPEAFARTLGPIVMDLRQRDASPREVARETAAAMRTVLERLWPISDRHAVPVGDPQPRLTPLCRPPGARQNDRPGELLDCSATDTSPGSLGAKSDLLTVA